MFSIIVCSIDPESATRLESNIAQTIGVPFEFIAFDNRETGRGICSVYNECARRAKYDLLCFVHEDVVFRTQEWGRILAEKLAEEDCGVIGFAGGAMKLRVMSGWCVDRHDARQYYAQPEGGQMKRHSTNPDGVDYAPVICLDGFCQVTRRKVWEAAPYDEDLLTGFHAYDLDFSTAAACRFRNYTCNIIDVEHNSTGKYSLDWLGWVKIYHQKWHDRLPMFTYPRLSEAQIEALNRRAEVLWIKKLMCERLYSRRENLRMVVRYICKNLGYSKAWKLVLKLLRYGLHPKNN